jgi:predicted nucleotide-binding protein
VDWNALDMGRRRAILDIMAATFPKMTLEDTLVVPKALLRNGGNPMTKIDMATAVNKSPGSSTIRTLSASSSSYGLTGGSYKTTFTMDTLGRAITSPTSPEEAANGLVAAALTPPVFKAVYEYYKGKKVPEREFLINTVVREFDVAQGNTAETFADIFLANMRFVGLIKNTPGGEWLTEAPDVSIAGTPSASDPTQPDPGVDSEDDAPEDEKLQLPPAPPVNPPADPAKKKRPNKLFIGHGKNKTPLNQLTKVLRDLGIPYLVAEDEPNAGRPISTKVRETMDQCGAAILVFSADVEYFDKDENPVWRPSENVSHELGAAAVMYDNRIILFKEESITLASNFSGIGYITFAKDKLEAETNQLLRELVALKILRLSVGEDE